MTSQKMHLLLFLFVSSLLPFSTPKSSTLGFKFSSTFEEAAAAPFSSVPSSHEQVLLPPLFSLALIVGLNIKKYVKLPMCYLFFP